jgi:predicted flap endonuclease-1-like 5' DNA nuclease
MTELLWQTTFLLVGAFFFGAVLACGMKRRFYYGTSAKVAPARAAASLAPGASPAPDASQPKIEVAARPAAEAQKFERVLSGKSAAPVAPAPPAPAASKLVVPPTAVKVGPVKAPAPVPVQPAPKASPTAQPAPKPSIPPAAAAPLKVEEGGAAPSDDLTRIRGIDPVMQRRLKELGIRRFQDVAGLTPTDVKGLNGALDLKGRIDEENWVGQAQILATGGETYYSRRRDRGIPVPEAVEPAALAPAAESAPPRPAPSAPAAPMTTAPAVAPAEARPAHAVSHLRSVRSEALRGEEGVRAPAARTLSDVDDLKRIRGIGVLIEKKLNSLGITYYEQVANWTGADIERISRILDFKGRIERENWIEQARILATGGQTEFSRRGER